jgi:xanthine dehydrogenase YagS FAD-binding subunit
VKGIRSIGLSQTSVALKFEADEICRHASIILGAAAPIPHRAKKAETVLVGKKINEKTAQQAARAALEGATPLAKNAYKLPLFETLVRRALFSAAGREPGR